MKRIVFVGDSIAEFQQYRFGEPKLAFKIFELLEDIQKHPFEGLGKPEPMKGDMQGCWSRRINQEHRLVYEVVGDEVRVLACRSHYEQW